MSPSDKPPPAAKQRVFWTIQARRSLRRNPVAVDAGGLTQERLDQVLAGTFRESDVIVHNVLFGFQLRPERQILLVEAVSPRKEACGSFVVKVGPAEKVRQEWRSWEACARPGLAYDPVFQPLLPGYGLTGLSDASLEPFASIVYGNALQFIGVDEEREAMSLEKAVLQAVRFDSPSIGSVLQALKQIFDRAGQVLYDSAQPTKPGTMSLPPPIERLPEALDRWHQVPELRNLCSYIETHVDRLERSGDALAVRRYLSPVYFLRYATSIQARGPKEVAPGTAALASARPEDVIPSLLRGPSHGDLHGRNVLVGVEREEVCWPAIFDYGNMRLDNFIALDFIKLETDLKMRAYPVVFEGKSRQQFTRAVHDAEWQLGARSDEFTSANDWPAGAAGPKPLDRLQALVLKIRALAAAQLGYSRARNDWLQEYYFLLCCYGVLPAIYETYSEKNLIAGWLSAAVAAARLKWSRQRFAEEMRRAQELAR